MKKHPIMKKTLNEEKQRILKLIEQSGGNFESSKQTSSYDEQNKKLIKKLHNLLVNMYAEIRDRDGYKFAEADAELKQIVKNAMYRLEHGSGSQEKTPDVKDINANVLQDPRGFGYGYTRPGSPDDIKI